jgi:phosphatidylglycerol:prolipoprotein diacylglycerol transferase
VLPFVFAFDNVIFGVSVWGIPVCFGGWAGYRFAERLARKRSYDLALFNSAFIWIVMTGLMLGHIIDETFYHPDVLIHRPLSLFQITNGQSSCGGFVGAAVGGVLWKYIDVKREGIRVSFARRPRPLALLPVAEILMATFPVTWVFARLGCALVHDHPGRLAPIDSWFALAWPIGPEDGVIHNLGPLHYVFGSTSRYDLGLLECLLTIPLALGLAMTWRRQSTLGFYTAVVCLTYAPVRFALDFLRVTGVPEADPRYASLTFAQWFCIVMFGVGVAVAGRMRSQPRQAGTEPAGA